MKMSVKEFSVFTGVSVRTLHYYDEIGLLKPDFVDSENGYRYYSDKATERMLEILFLKELDFPLREIATILSSPDYDKKEAFRKQKKLLTIKKERLERLISALEKAERKEVNTMKKFDNTEFERVKAQYSDEVKQRWGDTAAYKESEEKAAAMTTAEKQSAFDGMNFIMTEFSDCMKNSFPPESEAAQSLCKKLQQFITDNFYTCTKEILAGLGEMYVLDERFKQNIDKNGEGTAEFIRAALKFYCK